MIRWGVILLFLGIGSFILPLIGMQFRLINIFGDDPATSAIVFIIAGAVLVAIGKARERGPRAAAPSPAAPQAPAVPQNPPPRPTVPANPQPLSAAGGSRFCGNCGAAVKTGAKFCASCGQAV
jgi:hypothetical protein